MAEIEPHYGLTIIGGGPAANGVLVAADREHAMPLLLRNGVAMIDGGSAASLGKGGLEHANISSNTTGASFTIGIREGGWYGDVLNGNNGMRIDALADTLVPLATVAAPVLGDIGQQSGKLLEASPQSTVRTGSRIIHVEQHSRDGRSVYIAVADNGERFPAKNIIMATGAAERPLDLGRHSEKIVLSGSLFTDDGLDEVWGKIKASNKKRVAIIGGSHAGFSAAQRLLTTFGIDGIFDTAAITLFYRENPKLFFPSAVSASNSGYAFTEGDVCPSTGSINRIRGLRGDAKLLLEAVAAGDERRIALQKIGDLSEADETLGNADVIIQAVGPKVREIPIVNAAGKRIGPERDNGHVVVDAKMRVYGNDGEPIEGVYGIGLGYGIRPSETFGGEPNAKHGTLAGVNIYQGLAGREIVRQLASSM